MSKQSKPRHERSDEAFTALVETYGQGVLLRVESVLHDPAAVRRVVREVFTETVREQSRAQAVGGFNAGIFIAYATEKAILEARYGAAAAGTSAAVHPPAEEARPAPEETPAPRAYAGAQTAPEKRDNSPEAVLERAKARLAAGRTADAHESRPARRTAPAAADAPAQQPQTKGKKERAASGNALLTAGIILLGLLLIWILLGILMDMGIFPQRDFGYRFFNDKLFRLFQSF